MINKDALCGIAICLGGLTVGCQLPVREVQPDILAREALPKAVTAGYTQQFAAARQLEQSQQWEEAAEAYEKLSRIAPSRSEPLHRLAVIADHRADFANAHKLYEKALSLDPDNASLRNDFGYSLLLAGAFNDAIEQLKIAVEGDSAPPRAQNNLAMALVQSGDDEAALAWFLAANSEADGHYNMAFALEQRGREGDAATAMKHLQAALQAEPQHEQAAVAMASERPHSSAHRLVAYQEQATQPPAALPNARSGAARRVLHRRAQAAAREGVSR